MVMPPAAESIKLKAAPVEAPLPVIAWVSVRVTLPEVFAVTLGVVSVSGPITPEPVLKAIEVEPVIIPAPVMVPVVDAVIVSTVPKRLAPMAIPPEAVVANSPRVPVAVMVLLRVIAPAPAALSVRLKLLPVEAPLPVMVWVSVNVTLPEVFAVMLGVARVSAPITPEPLVKATELVPVIVPAPVMVPVVVAVIVSTVPDTLAAIAMPPVTVVASNERVPVAVIVLLRVIAPAPPAVSVRLKLAPVEAPLPVIA